MIDINDFVGHDDCRKWLNFPFKHGDRVCATNGHMIISFKSDKPFPDLDLDNPEHVIKIITDSCEGDFFEIADLDMPVKKVCYSCDGSRKIKASKCPECDGEWTVEATSFYGTDYTVDCMTCDCGNDEEYFNNDKACDICDADGMALEELAHIRILGVNINPVFFDKINALDEPLYFKADEQRQMIYFKTGKYNGAVMGMRL